MANEKVDALVAKARAAQAIAANYTQEQVDDMVKAVAHKVWDDRENLAKIAHEDTGKGTYDFKMAKLRGTISGTYMYLKGRKSVGLIEHDEEKKLWKYAKPVGVLACIEKVNPKMPETVEAAELKRMNEEGEITGCFVEGPISYDCAMSPASAKEKNFNSPAAGDCDILIAPNIHAANILSKALTVTCKAESAGCIIGAKCPVVISSRGSSPEEKCNSIMLAAAVVLGE